MADSLKTWSSTLLATLSLLLEAPSERWDRFFLSSDLLAPITVLSLYNGLFFLCLINC